MDIYVGNLPWSMDDDGLKQLFEEHGEVSSAKIIKDRKKSVLICFFWFFAYLIIGRN